MGHGAWGIEHGEIPGRIWYKRAMPNPLFPIPYPQ